MAEPPLNFISSQERDKWIIENADYFTVIRRQNRRNQRFECQTLKNAIDTAESMVAADPEARFLIYAVAGIHDCFVGHVDKVTLQAHHEQDTIADDTGRV